MTQIQPKFHCSYKVYKSLARRVRHLVRIELTSIGVQHYLANHYNMQGSHSYVSNLLSHLQIFN